MRRSCAALSVAFLSSVAHGQPIRWEPAVGGNGHYYERVSGTTLTWHQARDAAASRTHAGLRGHLATFTSAQEWSFINSGAFLPEPGGAWIGADQAQLGSETLEGWRWTTGEPFGFSKWLSGSPDNAGDEDAMAIGGAAEYGWIDTSASSARPVYLVEYEPSREDDGLLAHFTFDGHAIDLSGHGYAGIVDPGVGFTFDPRLNSIVAVFDGTTGLIRVPHDGSLSFDMDTESHTVALWVYSNGTPARNTTFLQDRWASDGAVSYSVALIVDRAPEVPPLIASNSWYGAAVNVNFTTVSPTVPLAGVWHHVATTYDAATGIKKLYIDGELVNSVNRPSQSFTPANSAKTMSIGGSWYPDGVQHLNGRIDDLRLYNRALAPEEIAVIGTPRTCDADFNHDGNWDQQDVDALINVIAGGDCSTP